MEDAKMECSYAVLSLATVGLLSLGSAIGFAVLAMLSRARELPDMPKPDVVAVPEDAAAVTWQAAELMFDLAGRIQKHEPIEGALLDVSRALHRVADRFPQVLH
jgi:hypothetical protein